MEPPNSRLNPKMAMMLTPNQPPPSLRSPSKWSAEFRDFLSACLTKNPKNRGSAQDLLQHPFLQGPRLVVYGCGLLLLRVVVGCWCGSLVWVVVGC